jgi:beta propeller repeat protein
MTANWRVLVGRGAALIVTLLLLIGQGHAEVAAAEMVCLRIQVNPDNERWDYNPVVNENYIAWESNDESNYEIYIQNRMTEETTQITDNGYDNRNPQMDGDYLVWQDENGASDSWDIVLHNLPNGETTTLNPNSSDDIKPLIEGDHVVWTTEGNTKRVRHYNIATDTTQNIAQGFGGNEYEAFGIHNGRVVYKHVNPSNQEQLYVFNIEDGTTTHLTDELPDGDGKYRPAISGNSVVFEYQPAGLSNDHRELYFYNLPTGTLAPFTDDDHKDRDPAISGKNVVFVKETDSADEMHLYHLQTKTSEVIASAPPGSFRRPFIKGNTVAWQSNQGIFTYDLMTETLTQLSNYEESSNLFIFDDRVYWSGTENEQPNDIFTADCGYAPTIVTQPKGKQISSGQTTTLEVVAQGDHPLEYQWYIGQAGDFSSPIAGATSATLITPPLTQSTKFWVKVSNPYGVVNSIAVQVQVVIVIGVTASPTSDQTVTATPTATFEEGATLESTSTAVFEESATPTPDNSSTLEPTVESSATGTHEGTLAPSATATLTLTPTQTLPGSIQILPNTDFELDTDGDKIPDGWSAKGTPLNKADKLKRNKLQTDGTIKQVAYSGESAFMFKGNPDGTKSKIGYKPQDFSMIADGSTLEFSVYVNRFNVAPGTTIGKVKIRFSDGTKESLQLTTPVEQVYTSVSDSLLVNLAERTIDKFKVEFSTNITGGKFMIDAASLLVIPGQPVAQTGLLPLP